MLRDDFYNIEVWVKSESSRTNREMRQAVHTILAAVAHDPELKSNMVVKGGMLLAVRYRSSRFTKDIDFSTTKKLADIDAEQLVQQLDDSLRWAVEELSYGVDCRVQSWELMPPKRPTATFPCLRIKVGYAERGTPKHKKLLKSAAPTIISIDFSLNEVVCTTEPLNLGSDQQLTAYTFTDLVAEKYRALLQQTGRNRYRRQDVYDLSMLVNLSVCAEEKAEILRCLLLKAQAREITPTKDSLDDAELKHRAEADYATLQDEVLGHLPLFDDAYEIIRTFFKSLPWPESKRP